MLANTPRPFGGDADPVIGQAVVGGRENQQTPPRSEARNRRGTMRTGRDLEFSDRIRAPPPYARAGLEQASGLAQRYFAGAHYQHRTVLEVQEMG